MRFRHSRGVVEVLDVQANDGIAKVRWAPVRRQEPHARPLEFHDFELHPLLPINHAPDVESAFR